jgi:hypothetical protein
VIEDFPERLRTSLAEQKQILRSPLNPVENFPFADDLAVTTEPLHGPYNSDKTRARRERLSTHVQCVGRESQERDSRAVYAASSAAHELSSRLATLVCAGAGDRSRPPANTVGARTFPPEPDRTSAEHPSATPAPRAGTGPVPGDRHDTHAAAT